MFVEVPYHWHFVWSVVCDWPPCYFRRSFGLRLPLCVASSLLLSAYCKASPRRLPRWSA